MPTPARPISQDEDFGSSGSARLVIDGGEELVKGLTIGHLGLENLVQELVPLFTHFGHSGLREREHGLGFPIALILPVLAWLTRRA